MTKHRIERRNYSVSVLEIQDGFVNDKGVFYLPMYSLRKNGEPLLIMSGGGITASYPYVEAYHIMLHLESVTDDDYSLMVSSWSPTDLILCEEELKLVGSNPVATTV